MKKLTPIFSLLALSLTLSAQAGVVFKSGDWQLDDSIPNDPSKGICQAMTSGKIGSAVVYLSLVVDKTGARPLEIYLIPNRPTIGASAMYVQTDAGTYYLAKLPPTGGKENYWNIPVDSKKFVDAMRASNSMTFKAVSGATGSLPLSMAGATAVTNELQKRCTKNNTLYPSTEFEKAFLPENNSRFQIKNITPAKAAQLRDLIASAVPAYIKLRAIQRELQALENKFSALTRERTQLQTDLANLKGNVVPTLTNARDVAQAKIDRATIEIADLQAQIASKQVELETAKVIAGEAYERLRPLIPEHDRLLSLRRSDERRLGAARDNLSDIDSGIQSSQHQISRLNSEVDQLNYALPDAQNEVRRGQNGLDDANRAYQSFDPRREIHERFNRDPHANRLEREIQQFRGQVQNFQAQVQNNQRQVQIAQQALNQCRNGRGAIDTFVTFSSSIMFAEVAFAADDNAKGPGRGRGPGNGPGRPGNGPGRPGNNGPGDDGKEDGAGRPGRPGNGPGNGPGKGPNGPGNGPGGPGNGPGNGPGKGPDPRPTPPAPTPPAPTPPAPTPPAPPAPPTPPNCSVQEANLNNAQANLNNAQAQLNNAQAQLNQRQNQLQRIRENIEHQVRREHQEYASRVNEWQQYLQNAQSKLRGIQDRLDNILRYDLPRAQSALRDYESRRPGAVTEVNSAEYALANSSAAFNSYKASVDYDNIRDEANRTAGVVSEIQRTIAGYQAGVSSRQALIREQTGVRDALIKRLAETMATIDQKEARLVQVDAALAAYDTQKAEIMGRMSLAQGDLRLITDQYGDVLLK